MFRVVGTRVIVWTIVGSVGGWATHTVVAQDRSVFVHVVNQSGQAVTNLAWTSFW